MKYFKKIVSVIIAAALALGSMTVLASAEEETMLNGMTTSEAYKLTEDFTANGENYSYLPMSRAATVVGTVFDKYGALSSDDAIDFYPFSLSSSRSVIFRFLSTDSNYMANLASYTPSDGNVTLSNFWLNPGDVKWSSNLAKGNYCWVILSNTNTYTTGQYRMSMNAYNASGATAHIATSADFSYSTFKYSGGTLLMNGTNIRTKYNNFIETMDEFQDRYEGALPTHVVATVKVATSKKYICDTPFYGSYTSTNPHTNPINGLGHSTEHAIFIPIEGNVFACTYSTQYVPTQFVSDTANGILVYDLISGEVIDYMSSSNIFYTQTFGYSFSYNSYTDL